MKRKLINILGTSLIVVSPIVIVISCGSKNKVSITEIDLVGEDIISVNISTSSNAELTTVLNSIHTRRNRRGEHFAVTLSETVNGTTTSATMVYAIKSAKEGFDASKDYSMNILPYEGDDYVGYRHLVDGVKWEHNMSYYELLTALENKVAGFTEKEVVFADEDVIVFDVATATQATSNEFLTNINTWKVTPGKHTAIKIVDGTSSSLMVYAVKSMDEGYLESTGGNYLLPFDQTGYEGYTHIINGVEWVHDFAFYNLLAKVRLIANPLRTVTIESANTFEIDLGAATQEQAVEFVNKINEKKQTKGLHSAFTITSATKTSSMIYAVKTDAEGYVQGASNNLLPFQGNGYINTTHILNGTTWTHDSQYYVLHEELLVKAGLSTALKDKTLEGDSIIEIDLTTATTNEAKLALHKIEVSKAEAGSHIALKIINGNVTSTMVYATKSVEEGFVLGDTTMSDNLIAFEGTGYAGYNHIINGTTWVHDQSFYGLIGLLRGLANQHSGDLNYNIVDSEIIEIDLNGLTKAEAVELLTIKNNWIKVPGKHFAMKITSADGSTSATMAYAYKMYGAEGFDKNASSNLLSYNTTTMDYIGYVHYINNQKWVYNTSFNSLNAAFNAIANS